MDLQTCSQYATELGIVEPDGLIKINLEPRPEGNKDGASQEE